MDSPEKIRLALEQDRVVDIGGNARTLGRQGGKRSLGQPTGQSLVDDDPQREKVTMRLRFGNASLLEFTGEVVEWPLALGVELGRPDSVENIGEPETHDSHRARLVDEDARRSEGAVENLRLVRAPERSTDLLEEL